MLEERWKVAEFSKCKACPFVMYTDIPYPGNESGLSRIILVRRFVGCHQANPTRYFFNDVDIETIPEWCPLPDAPGHKE